MIKTHLNVSDLLRVAGMSTATSISTPFEKADKQDGGETMRTAGEIKRLALDFATMVMGFIMGVGF